MGRGGVNASIGSVKGICKGRNSIVDRGLVREHGLRLGRRGGHVLRIVGLPRR